MPSSLSGRFPILPNKCPILSLLCTSLTAPTLTGLMLCSENSTNQKELPHLPIWKPSHSPISAPILCLSPAQQMNEGHCSAQVHSLHVGPGSHLCHLLKDLSVSSFCITTFSLSAGHPFMAGGVRALGSPIISKLHPAPHFSQLLSPLHGKMC